MGREGGRAPEFHSRRQKTRFNVFICCEMGGGGARDALLPRAPKKQKKQKKTKKQKKQKNKKQKNQKKKKTLELPAATSQNINKLMFYGVWKGVVEDFPSTPKNLIPLFPNFGELMFCGSGWVGGPRPSRGSRGKSKNTRTNVPHATSL